MLHARNNGEPGAAWEYDSGDVSDGLGDLPEIAWSARPLYANGTPYPGSPFYRVIAHDPATDEEI